MLEKETVQGSSVTFVAESRSAELKPLPLDEEEWRTSFSRSREICSLGSSNLNDEQRKPKRAGAQIQKERSKTMNQVQRKEFALKAKLNTLHGTVDCYGTRHIWGKENGSATGFRFTKSRGLTRKEFIVLMIRFAKRNDPRKAKAEPDWAAANAEDFAREAEIWASQQGRPAKQEAMQYVPN
jgi:hypothetical protein